MKRMLSSMRRGLWSSATAASCALLLATSAQAQLEIIEVMYNPNDENAWEWIEVRNTSGADINLDGYLGFNLGDNDLANPNPTINSTYAQNTVIPANGIAVIYDGNYGSGSAPTANPNNFVDANFRTAWGLAPSVPLIAANFWPEMINTNGSQGKSIGFWANVDAWRADQTPTELNPETQPGVLTGVTTGFSNAAFYLDFSNEDTFPAVDGDSSITYTGSGDRNAGTNWYKSVSGTNGATTSAEILVAGSANGLTDRGNPGVVGIGSPSTPGVYITEVMFNPSYEPAAQEAIWEWVEIYNSTTSAINLSGWVIDDINNVAHNTANIAEGTIAPNDTAILYNAALSPEHFKAAWGSDLNIVPVANWSALALNNFAGGDAVAIWDSFESYEGDHNVHANAVNSFDYRGTAGFAGGGQGQSIYWNDLSSDQTSPDNWDFSIVGDSIGSIQAPSISANVPLHPGGDVGSPGTFVPGTVGTPGDFNSDGKVDGRDFLLWQRNTSVGDLADWQSNYGAGGLASIAAVPEPAALALLALASVPVACGRKR